MKGEIQNIECKGLKRAESTEDILFRKSGLVDDVIRDNNLMDKTTIEQDNETKDKANWWDKNPVNWGFVNDAAHRHTGTNSEVKTWRVDTGNNKEVNTSKWSSLEQALDNAVEKARKDLCNRALGQTDVDIKRIINNEQKNDLFSQLNKKTIIKTPDQDEHENEKSNEPAEIELPDHVNKLLRTTPTEEDIIIKYKNKNSHVKIEKDKIDPWEIIHKLRFGPWYELCHIQLDQHGKRRYKLKGSWIEDDKWIREQIQIYPCSKLYPEFTLIMENVLIKWLKKLNGDVKKRMFKHHRIFKELNEATPFLIEIKNYCDNYQGQHKLTIF
eukprot:UN31127